MARPFLKVPIESKWAYAAVRDGTRPELALYVAEQRDLARAAPRWHRVATVADAVTAFEAWHDDLYVLTHRDAPRGKVIRWSQERHFGTIEAADGHELYFHQNSVIGNGLKRLRVGAKVAFVEEQGEKGPQASTVRLVHPRRRTVGIRVPDHPVALALLAALDAPLLSSTLIPTGETTPLSDPDAIREQFENQLDAIVDGGICGSGATSVVDLTVEPPAVVRHGSGNLARLGLAVE
jgi:cold shock CspA family protein